jgi:hypothetical protein
LNGRWGPCGSRSRLCPGLPGDLSVLTGGAESVSA